MADHLLEERAHKASKSHPALRSNRTDNNRLASILNDLKNTSYFLGIIS
jgi:hypothetical protein